MAEIRILLADSQAMFREGLRLLFERDEEMTVVGECSTGMDLVEKVGRVGADVVICEIALPDLNGIEATRLIQKTEPGLLVIGLTQNDNRRLITEMLRAGARGCLLKSNPFEELLKAVRRVVGGHAYLGPQIADVVVSDIADQSGAAPVSPFVQLTPREREVMQLLAEGHSTKEIALKCRRSVKTVEAHRQHIMTKLGLNGIAELTKCAIREGVTSL